MGSCEAAACTPGVQAVLRMLLGILNESCTSGCTTCRRPYAYTTLGVLAGIANYLQIFY